jgi:hypothetical protein
MELSLLIALGYFTARFLVMLSCCYQSLRQLRISPKMMLSKSPADSAMNESGAQSQRSDAQEWGFFCFDKFTYI